MKRKNLFICFFINEFCKLGLLGSKTADGLRAKLKEAMKGKDRIILDKVISECVSAGMPELDVDIQKARSVADILRGGTGG